VKVADLIQAFRTDADDFGNPPLWSDEEIARYLSEGEEEAAIRKHLLYDDYTTALCVYPVPTGQSRIKRNAKVFEVSKVWLQTHASQEPRPLRLMDRDDLDGVQPNWKRDRGDPDFAVVTETDITLAGLISRPYILTLEGYRLPLKPLSADNDGQEPEIGPVHHRFLVYWALHRAYQKPDSETLNPSKSATALADFEAYFGYRNQANQGARNRSDTPHRNRVW
jgi:hypothetical protein